MLSFGLIWLDRLRRREKRLAVEGLALYVPRGQELHTSLRLPWLNPEVARYELFAYDEHDFAARIDPRDFGNVDTRVDVCRRPAPLGAFERLLESPEVERVARHDGAVSLRVRGVEFAQVAESGVRFGMPDARAFTPDRWLADFEALAIRDEVRPLVLKQNAARLLGL